MRWPIDLPDAGMQVPDASRVSPFRSASIRIEKGGAPSARQVSVGGRRVPYWDVPLVYAPYAGGFFGGLGSILPGLLIGFALGSAIAYAADAGSTWPSDEGGAGDFVDAESGFDGGDFGGGDFGG